MQFFLFHSLSARSLQNKASFSCTQSGTTSTSLPGHPILCIPSYWDVLLVAGYTEVRTVLWVSCGLDQLFHHISIGTILVTAVHRDEEWQHWLVCATPQEELHPKFQFSWKSPPTAHKHSPQEGAAVLPVTLQGNTNHVLWGALHHTVGRYILPVWVLGSF